MKRAIIIGATSGMGRELALLLVANNYKVGITGRRLHLLEALKNENPSAFIISNFDIKNTCAVLQNLNDLTTTLGGLDVLVISAGIGDINIALDITTEHNTINTNVAGFTTIATWAFNYFTNQRYGQLVAITSVGGIRGSRHAPAYNASKAYQINYLEGLRQKATQQKSGIHITDVRAGFVNTEMAKGDGLFWVMPLHKAVTQIYSAIKAKKHVVYVTKRWRLIAIIVKLLPRYIYNKL